MAAAAPVAYDRLVAPPAHPAPARRGEDGQTSIEYLGMVLVSAAVLAVVLKAAPGLGEQIVDLLQKQIDAILGA